MQKTISILRQTRSNFIELLDGLSLEQINTIPPGYNNNIVWNFGHSLISQQSLCYVRPRFEAKVSQALISKYQRGSKPENFVEADELEVLKNICATTIDALLNDYKAGFFTNFAPFTTSYGVELTNIDDTIKFLPVHEALHLGYAMALKRLV